jgi:hypothetical protein
MSHWEPGVGFFCLFQGWEKGWIACERPFTPARPLSFLFRTYAVIYLDDFLAFWTFLGFCFTLMGRDGYHIFFKDLEAETIHVCIAWALLKYLGFVFWFCCTLTLRFFVYFSTIFLFLGLYIGFMGEWVTCEYSLLPLPRGAVAGWGVLVAQQTMGCGVVFCLKSISWGSLAEHAIDHIALKMVYITLCLCLTFYLGTIHFITLLSTFASFLCLKSILFLGWGLCYIKLLF